MKYNVLSFALNQIDVLTQDEDVIICKLRLLHTGINHNQCDISKQAVLDSMESFYNKPIIYRLNNTFIPEMATDVTEHSKDKNSKAMDIAGSIIESGGHEFIVEDDIEYLEMVGVIHKMYQPIIAKILAKKGGEIKVSIELKPLIAHATEDGILVIEKFKFLSCCLLADKVECGIEGSKLECVKFSSDDYNDKYLKFSQKEIFRGTMGTKPPIKLNKLKDAISTKGWENIDKTTLRNQILDAKNYKTLVKAVYLEVLEGWQDAPSTKLKFPVMELQNNELVYNRYGISSALGYAKAEGRNVIVSKAENLYEKLEIDEGGSNVEEKTIENAIEAEEFVAEEEVVENAEVEIELDGEKEEEKEEPEVEVETEVVDEKYAELENKCNSLAELNFEMSEKIKAFERKEEMVQMQSLMEEFAHCYVVGDKEELETFIESFSYSEFEAKVNEKVKAFAKKIKEDKVVEKPEAQSFSMGLPIEKVEVKDASFSIENYLKNSKVVLGK